MLPWNTCGDTQDLVRITPAKQYRMQLHVTTNDPGSATRHIRLRQALRRDRQGRNDGNPPTSCRVRSVWLAAWSSWCLNLPPKLFGQPPDQSLLSAFYLSRCRTLSPPLFRLVHFGSLNNTDSHLVARLQITLQPLKKFVGTAQATNAQIQ